MTGPGPRPMTSLPCGPLRGSVRVIGDKSLTHRALILGAVADGTSRIDRPNPGEDCRATARALARLGASVRAAASGWIVRGCAGFRDPDRPLDLRNAGTGIRLLTGLLAGRPTTAVLTGDRSLRCRPMKRIAEPLERMGATILLRDGEFPPIAVRGANPAPIHAELKVASAQVKGSILLAGLGLREGEIEVIEPGRSRDHTERLFGWLDLPLTIDGDVVRLRGPVRRPSAFGWEIPADLSAAAFTIVAALLAPGSEIRVTGVLLNPTRSGALDVLRAMGADLVVEPDPVSGPEPTGTIIARSASLRGASVGGDLLLRAIDEVPILAIAAAASSGETIFRDARELRVKESDRIEATAALVRAIGGEAETGPDWLRIIGKGRIEGGAVAARGDHRIAMSALIAGCVSRVGVRVDDVRSVATSDPSFFESLAGLGGNLG